MGFKTFRFDIDMDYVAGDGAAIGGLLVSLGQSMMHLSNCDLRELDNSGKQFYAELRDGNDGSGRVFARADVNDEVLDTTPTIDDPSAVIDASVPVPRNSEAAQRAMQGDHGRDS